MSGAGKSTAGRMNKEQIIQKVKVDFAEKLGMDSGEVKLRHSIDGDLEASDEERKSIMRLLAHDFGIEIPDNHSSQFTDVESVVDYIDRLG